MTELSPPQTPSRWCSRIVLAAFAFLLASTPAVATSLWWHLAEGRRIAESANVFARLSGGATHATPIYDIWTYLSYLISPQFGIVVGHALLAALGVFLSFGLRKSGWGLLSMAVSGVAVLAMGVSLPATSATAALALVGVVTCILQSYNFDRLNWKPVLLLVGAQVVWANVDGSFILGLLLVAGTLLGRAVDAPAAIRGSALRTALVSVVLVAVACLANPLHNRKSLLPEFIQSGQSISPFTEFYRSGVGSSPAGLAFFAILLLGVASFLLNKSARRWESLLPWAILGALASWKAPAVPFFALISGPILASNFGRVISNDPAKQPGRFQRYTSGFLAAVVTAAFFVAAWPGWLQPSPFSSRGWVFAPPEAYEQSAKQVSQWYQDGLIPADWEIQHISQESADAFAWFAPKLSRKFDPSRARTILTNEIVDGSDWGNTLTKAKVRLIVVASATQEDERSSVARLLLQTPLLSPPLLLKGPVWVFGWKAFLPGDKPVSFSQFYDERLEYNPKLVPLVALPEPADEEPTNRWLRPFRLAVPHQTTDRDYTANLIRYADALAFVYQRRPEINWKSLHIAALTGSAASWSSPFSFTDAWLNVNLSSSRKIDRNDPYFDLFRFAATSFQQYVVTLNDIPPQIYFAAIRSARLAIQADPTDARAYAMLGECYLRLTTNTSERDWIQSFEEFRLIRHVQIVSALTTAVTLDPQLAESHKLLATAYEIDGSLDLAVVHAARYCELTGQTSSENPYGRSLATLRSKLAESERAYQEKSDKLRILDQAEVAVSYALVGKGRDLLLTSDLAAFGASGARRELELMLRTGRAAEIRAWEKDLKDLTKMIDPGLYRWIRIQELAATGRFNEAAQLAAGIPQPNGLDSPVVQRKIATMAARLVLDDVRTQSSLPILFNRTLTEMETDTLFRSIRRQHQSDLTGYLFQGLFALEGGDVAGARSVLNLVLELTTGSGQGSQLPHRRIAQHYLRCLE